MAFILSQEDEEDKKKQGDPTQISGSGAGDTSGTGVGAPSGPQAGPDHQFTDVGSYLDANKDQATDLGNKVVGQINDSASQLRGAIDTAKGDFDSRVSAGSTPFDQSLVDNALKDPASFAKDDNNVANFSKMRDASYSGPTDFSAMNPDLAGRVKSAADEAAGVDTSAGRRALLMKLRPNATAGQVTLDDMLLGGNPTARANMGQAAQQFGTINDYLSSVNGGENTAASKAKADTDATRAAVGSRLTGATTSFDADLNARTAAARTAAAKQNADLAAAVKSGNLTPEQLKALGISPDQWSALQKNTGALSKDWSKNFDINPFLSAESPDAKLSRANVASPDDYAREAALEKLSGAPLNLLDQNNAGQGGTAPTSLSRFNVDPALSGSGGELSELDKRLLAASGDLSPGAPGTNGMNADVHALKPQGMSDEDFFKVINDVYSRNPDQLNPTQQLWRQEFGPLFEPGAIVVPPGTPDPTTAGSTAGTSGRVRSGANGIEWQDGSGNWVPMPPSSRLNPDGTWSVFNPETGQYDNTGNNRQVVGIGMGGGSGIY